MSSSNNTLIISYLNSGLGSLDAHTDRLGVAEKLSTSLSAKNTLLANKDSVLLLECLLGLRDKMSNPTCIGTKQDLSVSSGHVRKPIEWLHCLTIWRRHPVWRWPLNPSFPASMAVFFPCALSTLTRFVFPHLDMSDEEIEIETGSATVKDVAAADFITGYASYLKKWVFILVRELTQPSFRSGQIQLPKYVDLVKTANFKDLAPYDEDWYYIRAGIAIFVDTSCVNRVVQLLWPVRSTFAKEPVLVACASGMVVEPTVVPGLRST
jgi:hypothetical protein